MAPNLYPHQCCHIASQTLRETYQLNFIQNTWFGIQESACENVFKMSAYFVATGRLLPNLYPHQCCHIASQTLRETYQLNFIQNTWFGIQESACENVFKMSAYFVATGRLLPPIWRVATELLSGNFASDLTHNSFGALYGVIDVCQQHWLRQWLVACTINSLRPRQNGRHFADDIFKCIFLTENVIISITISLKFVPMGSINNIPTLV